MKRKVLFILTVVFFLGFPGFGLYYFMVDAGNRIRQTADPFVRQTSNDILSRWDEKLLDDVGTLVLRQSDAEKQLLQMKARLGALKGLSGWTAERNFAGERDQEVWQFVAYHADAQFEKGPARLNVMVARRTLNPEWRVEKFEIVPR